MRSSSMRGKTLRSWMLTLYPARPNSSTVEDCMLPLGRPRRSEDGGRRSVIGVELQVAGCELRVAIDDDQQPATTSQQLFLPFLPSPIPRCVVRDAAEGRIEIVALLGL